MMVERSLVAKGGPAKVEHDRKMTRWDGNGTAEDLMRVARPVSPENGQKGREWVAATERRRSERMAVRAS